MGWPKGKARKPKVESPSAGNDGATVPTTSATPAKVVKTEFERKLDHFQYDESAVPQVWEQSNPLDVPPEVKKEYPNLAFKWRAKDTGSGGLRRGNQYDGWVPFRDGKRPDGVEVGGDLVLCAMPKERADTRNRKFREESTSKIKDKQDEAVDIMERGMREGGEYFQMTGGIAVGSSKTRDRRTGKVTEQHRGYHPEEIKERLIKARENASRGRKIFT